MPLSRTQIQKLGQRLAHAAVPSPEDLDLLAEVERSLGPARAYVVDTIRKQLGRNPTSRDKSARSIVAKLRRERTSLPRMQDIVGCRLVVDDVVEQEEVVERLCGLPWDNYRVEDRRQMPKHGYRAVHVIVQVGGMSVEIQTRSRAQDLWAQISEKMADRFGLEVKYGGGPPEARSFLNRLSEMIAETENHLRQVEELNSDPMHFDELEVELEALKSSAQDLNSNMNRQLNVFLATLST